MTSPSDNGNFDFLSGHDPLLYRLCTSAERNYHDDPNTTVIKLRQFGEAIVKHLAAVFNIDTSIEQTQADLLKTLQVRRLIDRNVADLLHYLRKEGNAAAHQFQTTQSQAKSALKIARELALNKQVMLSVDTNLEAPESRRVTFYTGRNNIFYLELAMDRTEFIKMNDFEASEAPDPDELLAQVHAGNAQAKAEAVLAEATDHEDLLKSLGM